MTTKEMTAKEAVERINEHIAIHRYNEPQAIRIMEGNICPHCGQTIEKWGRIMRDKFKVISTKGYNDGYYWDYRIWFTYDGKEYTYMNVGSCSGYIECAKAIAKGTFDLPEGYRNSRFSSNVKVYKEKLIGYVERLQASGEDEISLLEDQ